jgi:hypothetical protein
MDAGLSKAALRSVSQLDGDEEVALGRCRCTLFADLCRLESSGSAGLWAQLRNDTFGCCLPTQAPCMPGAAARMLHRQACASPHM